MSEKLHWLLKVWWLPSACLATSVAIGVWHFAIWRDWWLLSVSAVIWLVLLAMIISNYNIRQENKQLERDIEQLKGLLDDLRKIKDDSDKWKGEE